jgi:hypothetical protein
LANVLSARDHVVLTEDGGMVTPAGEDFFLRFGVDMGQLSHGRRAFSRPCLDWSERRLHLAGAVGAALAARCFELGWIAHTRDPRTLSIQPSGLRGFAEFFGIELQPSGGKP